MESVAIFFESVIYLVLASLVALIYILVFAIVSLYILETIKQKKLIEFNSIIKVYRKLFSSKSFKFFLLFFLGFNYFMYSTQRSEWINRKTIHHDAKEYFVVSVPIAFYKKALNLIKIKEDSVAMKPFNMLLESLYKKGVEQLPPNGGERFYWEYRFFNYWYIRDGGYMPNNDFYHPKSITKSQQKILDDMYDVMKGLATYQIEDKVVNEEKYKAFIATAKYYLTYDQIPYHKYIFNRLSDAKKAAIDDSEFIKKIKNILEWTLRFRAEYRVNKKLKKFIERKNPILGVSYYYVVANTSRLLIMKMIVNGDFNCSSKYLKLYFDTNLQLLSPESPLNYLSKSQQEFIKDFTFNSDYYKIFAYRLDKECGKRITVGYPSQEWIKDELPTERMAWLRDKKPLEKGQNDLIDFHINDTSIIRTPKGVIK